MAGIRNWWTTILGVALGAVTYLHTAGATMPTTPDEWWALALGALMAGLGVAAKDATTGSRPQ